MYRDIIERFPNYQLLVIGDLMLDKYIHGVVDRISPEAPVPVVRVVEETYALGGAGNVASNVVALGGKCSIVGILGIDSAATKIRSLFSSSGIDSWFLHDGRATTIKTRIITKKGHHFLRLDYESNQPIGIDVEKNAVQVLREIESGISVSSVIVSDYCKGMVTEEIIKYLLGRFSKVFVDPKPVHVDLYKGCYLMTPNYLEACSMMDANSRFDVDISRVHQISHDLSYRCDCNVLITLGEQGMFLHCKDGESRDIDPVEPHQVMDVVGAGDTVIAVMALARAAGASLLDAAYIASVAGSIAVTKVGTSPVTKEELLEGVQRVFPD